MLSSEVCAESNGNRNQEREQNGSAFVEIVTTDGRKVVGKFVPATRESYVTVRYTVDGIVLHSHIPRQKIKELRFGTVSETETISLATSNQNANRRAISTRTRAGLQSVAALSVSAQWMNWDRDREFDGIRLFVTPMSESGVPISTSGTLTAKLLARSVHAFREKDRIETMKEWSRQLNQNDFGPNGIIVNLPINQTTLKQTSSFLPLGVLRVQLGVSGQGVFEATEIRLPIRHSIDILNPPQTPFTFPNRSVSFPPVGRIIP